MSHGDFNRALSRATGESIRTIKQRGFSLVDPNATNVDDELTLTPPQIVDWDALDAERVGLAIQA